MELIEVDVTKNDLKKPTYQPPAPPALPPQPRWVTTKTVTIKSVTKQEIERFWRQKHMEEEDHLLAAIKAAARIRARTLTEEDYKRFEESMKDNQIKEDRTENNSKQDWWTKSKYAYLNQPAIDTMQKPKRASTYIPNNCFYKAAHSVAPNQVAYLGVY